MGPVNRATVRRVACSESPYIYAFYHHITCKIVIDTGATSSMISTAFVRRANLTTYPAKQGAQQLDKSPVPVKGECKFWVTFGHLELYIEALVTEKLDCDVLAGVPFGMKNDVMVHLSAKKIFIMGEQFSYGSKFSAPVSSIRSTESVILRNDATKVLYPGEFIELNDVSLSSYEGEISIEPRIDSPLQGTWPSPTISRVIQGVVRVPNNTSEPIYLSKTKHFAQVRHVSSPSTPAVEVYPSLCTLAVPQDVPTRHSDAVCLDPDNLLTQSERDQFRSLHLSYDKVFDRHFGTYNGASGPYKASICLGPVEPPCTKPMLPLYP